MNVNDIDIIMEKKISENIVDMDTILETIANENSNVGDEILA
jgi:hypothetical protein